MQYFVYILECRDGSFYTGITDNVARRFLEHKKKQGAKYTTSRGGANRLLYTEKHRTKNAALRREAEIKSWKRTKKAALWRYGRPKRARMLS